MHQQAELILTQHNGWQAHNFNNRPLGLTINISVFRSASLTLGHFRKKTQITTLHVFIKIVHLLSWLSIGGHRIFATH